MVNKTYRTVQVNKLQVRVHRHLMEVHIGRKLTHKEIVHHKDEDIFNNAIENLEIVSRSDHKKKHPNIGEKTRFNQKYNFDVSKITELYQNMTLQQIADLYNCVIGTVHYFIKKHNISKHGKS